MSERPPQMNTRRNVIKSAAGIVTTASIASSVTSAKQSESSIVEAGIKDRFLSLMEAGKHSKAFDLLEAHNVEYTTMSQSPSSGPSTQDYFEKNNSNVNFYTGTWNEDKDEYVIGLTWTIKNKSIDVDGPAPVDVAVLAFEQDIFGYKDDSIIHSGTLKDPDNSNSADGVSNLKSEPSSADLDAPDNASVVSFNDKRNQGDIDGDGVAEWYPVGEGYTQMVLRKQNTGTKGIVSGLYTHTWSFGNIDDWDILKNVSIPVVGGISVSVPDNADSWELPDSTSRDEEL